MLYKYSGSRFYYLIKIKTTLKLKKNAEKLTNTN